MKHFVFYYCFLQYVVFSLGAEAFPSIKFMSFVPVGFRIFIPHQNGMSKVTFNVNIGQPLPPNNTGQLSEIVANPINGQWSIESKTTAVTYMADVNYRISIQYGSETLEKEGSTKINRHFMNIYEPAEVNSATATLPSGCVRSITTVRGRFVCQGELIFEDNFDFLNWTMWGREVRIPLEDDDAEFVSYQKRPENFYINKGHLWIVPTLLQGVPNFNENSIFSGTLDLFQDCTGIVSIEKECFMKAMFAQILPPVVSARANTRHFFSFRYGKVEVRAKVPKGDWIIPLILLEPLENYYGLAGYASGQMRVASVRGNQYLVDKNGMDISGKQVSGGAILSRLHTYRKNWLKSTLGSEHFGNSFHVYTLTWTDKSIMLEVDGKRYSVVTGGFSGFRQDSKITLQTKRWLNGHYMTPFDREFYLTLGVAVGGHTDFEDGSRTGADNKLKPWANNHPKATLHFWKDRFNWLPTWQEDHSTLQVDYIRVYAA